MSPLCLPNHPECQASRLPATIYTIGERRGRHRSKLTMNLLHFDQFQSYGAALGQQGAEPELKSFCVLGLAPNGSTALIHHAAYLFTTLARWLWCLTSRSREGLYPGLHEPLMHYVGYGVPRTPLLGTSVNKPRRRAGTWRTGPLTLLGGCGTGLAWHPLSTYGLPLSFSSSSAIAAVFSPSDSVGWVRIISILLSTKARSASGSRPTPAVMRSNSSRMSLGGNRLPVLGSMESRDGSLGGTGGSGPATTRRFSFLC